MFVRIWSSLNYWALGGEHDRRTLLSGPVAAHYCGTTQGRRPGESGPRGCMLVQIDETGQERGKLPSRSVRLHRRIYREHPEIEAVITAQAPSATAYAVVGAPLDTRTIPESYILLRDIPLLPFGDQFGEGRETSAALSEERPIVLLQNDALLVSGGSVAETFDRLEVLEFSARSLNQSRLLGELVPISDEEITKLRGKFFGKG